MKILKYILALLLTISTISSFTSCSDDGYSLDKFNVALATVNPIVGDSKAYYLTLDDGTTLWPAAPNVVYSPKSDQRVIINYTLLSDQVGEYDHYAKINGLQEILTKKVVDLTVENETEIGNDPIKILDLWTGDNYLNIHFGINVGGVKTHAVNLVKNKLKGQDVKENDGTVELEFRHNKNGDEEKYGLKNYAAFDLLPLRVANQDSIKLIIKVQDFNDEIKTYSVTYKYKSMKQNKYITDMPGNNRLIR